MNYWILQEHIKRETPNAYLIECPNKGEFMRMQYWVAKRQIRKYQTGNFIYYSVWLPPQAEIQMSRFRGKNRPRENAKISAERLASLYYFIPTKIELRMEFEKQAMAADIAFEQGQRGGSAVRREFKI